MCHFDYLLEWKNYSLRKNVRRSWRSIFLQLLSVMRCTDWSRVNAVLKQITGIVRL